MRRRDEASMPPPPLMRTVDGPTVAHDDGIVEEDGPRDDEVTVPKSALRAEHIPQAPPPAQFQTPNVLNLDGTTSTHYPDGTQDVRAPDGRCWRIAPSGNIVHAWQEPPVPQWRPAEPVAGTQPDGATVVYQPDGSKDLWREGMQTMHFDADGRPTR